MSVCLWHGSPWCVRSWLCVIRFSMCIPLNLLSFGFNIYRSSDTERETESGHRMKLFPSNKRTCLILYPFCTRQSKRNQRFQSSSYINTLSLHGFLLIPLHSPYQPTSSFQTFLPRQKNWLLKLLWDIQNRQQINMQNELMSEDKEDPSGVIKCPLLSGRRFHIF